MATVSVNPEKARLATLCVGVVCFGFGLGFGGGVFGLNLARFRSFFLRLFGQFSL